MNEWTSRPIRAAGWATASCRPGDAVIFHCLTPHAAMPNLGPLLRLSGDFRWQLPGGPAPAEMILGPDGKRQELYGRVLRQHAWWEPVPANLALHPRAQLAQVPPGWSRFLAVHRGWRHWQPPPGAAH